MLQTRRLLLILLVFHVGCTTPPQLVQTVPVETTLVQRHLDTQAVWLELIASARQTICLGQFYASSKKGEALEPVLDALRAAAARGVKIRLLLSDKLLAPYQDTVDALRRFADVRILDLGARTGGILHCKYWIIDGRAAFVGSQNLDWRALTHIHELGLRLTDPGIVRGLERIFATDWAIAGGTAEPPTLPPAQAGDPAITLVASPAPLNPPGIEPALPALLALIASARHALKIQLLSYKPGRRWHVLDDALSAAAARGVQVRLLVSDWLGRRSNITRLAKLDARDNLTVRVATIPEHSSGKISYARVIHSKYMVVDDHALWLGTSNWSERYFSGSRNIELILRKPALADAVERIHDALWDGPYVKPISAFAKQQ